ncbi:phosphotransferase family protein [Nocardioides alcanivorans]|uniref:phosphotransferase family protein n=1 Tax=Nocardioides alcanivorans TaxID=2897352 RepID=UPI001F4533B9|nr:phosphotransferase family protein [Nocardioides alcanivorans]
MNALDADALPEADRARIESWLRAQGVTVGLGPARLLAGGSQNVVVAVQFQGREVVLRRPPVHPRPTSNRALQREMTVLAALAGSDVPHPKLLWACPDPEILGGDVFYLMELVDGFNPSVESSAAYIGDPARQRSMGLAVAAALGRLARVDAEATGLGSLGRPGFLARQVPQWTAVAEGYQAVVGYRADELPHLAEVGRWLQAHRPEEVSPAILHGDYQLANVLLHHDRPEVAAIIDWEMATVGDPLLDLGWLLVCWPGGDPEPIEQVPGSLAGSKDLATRSELIAAYGEASGRDLSAIDWYVAMAGFKLGILLDGTWARCLAGKADRSTGERLHHAAVGLLDAAHRIASGRWSLRDLA